MKTKLLTICLLLISSQVFSKEYTIYYCDDALSQELCNHKCRKSNSIYNFKINTNKNTVIFELTETDTGTKNVLDGGQNCKIVDKENWICKDYYSSGIVSIKTSIFDGKLKLTVNSVRGIPKLFACGIKKNSFKDRS